MTGAPAQAEHLDQQVREGLRLQQQGRLDQAKDIYDRVLAIEPDRFEALFYLSLLLHQQGDLARALDLMDRAIQLRPTVASVHSNRGGVLQSLHRLGEALESYDKAIAFKPDYATAFYNRGVVLKDLGRLDEALQSYDRAIALRPDDGEAFYNRGVVCRALGRLDEALWSYDRAIALRPDLPEAFSNRGFVLQELKRFDEALQSYGRAIAIKPDFAEALYNRGSVHHHLRRVDEALESYDQAIAINPDHFAALFNKGHLLKDLKRLDEALESYDRAIVCNPQDAGALSNRGIVLRELNRQGEARESLDQAIALEPDFAGAYLNRATVELLTGDMQNGWRDFEYRKLTDDPSGYRSFPQPVWLGETPLENRILLVHFELYLGDTIQFCRYLAELKGATVLFAPQKPLRRLMQGLKPAVSIVDPGDPSLQFDCHCPLLSLPLALGTTLETIPADIPYLFAEPDRVGHWRQTLGEEGFKIGVNWDTSAVRTSADRAFPLTALFALSQIPGVRLISLHKGDGEAHLDDLPEGMTVETLGPDFDAGDGAFLDTAAVMTCCDLVISPDTATAHLAGALGAPVWVALKHVPYWTWMLDRPDSPWYPTMTLFRQKTDGDWTGVFQDIEAGVVKAMAKRASVQKR